MDGPELTFTLERFSILYTKDLRDPLKSILKKQKNSLALFNKRRQCIFTNKKYAIEQLA